MAGGLRAAGPKADVALIVADKEAVVGGAFTQNVMCAAPVIYCKEVLATRSTTRAVSFLPPFMPACLTRKAFCDYSLVTLGCINKSESNEAYAWLRLSCTRNSCGLSSARLICTGMY